MIGQTIGHYKIVEKLGEGGMGVVYRAHDSRLNRPAAIKVLRPEKVGDAERRKRFVHEAQAASALNHPSIITIYDIDCAGGVDFIAMEYVDGKALDRLIGRRGLSLSETLKYSAQIADALAAAHSAGILHRDIKPGNIMVTERGLVKVLDFGLAKLTDTDGTDNFAPTESMRIEGPRTDEGTIVGTVAYMSPEQAEGKKLDRRSDIFSFGSVLYEMATGRRAFAGDTKVSTLSAILHKEPPRVVEVAEGIPRELERIINHCLRKDPARRFQHMDDVKTLLEELKEESESGELVPAVSPGRRSSRKPLLALALVIALAAAAAGWWMSRDRRSSEPLRERVLSRLTGDSGLTTDPAFSSDGKMFAFASDRGGEGNLDIWVQHLAGGEPVRLTRHEADDAAPVFSPDGSRIAFRSEREGGGIYIVPVLGGETRMLAKGGYRPRFSPDGSLVAYWAGEPTVSGKVWIVSSSGGSPRQFLPDFADVREPVWSPDAKRLLVWGARTRGPGPPQVDWWVAPVEGGTAVQTGAAAVLRGQGTISPASAVGRAPLASADLWIADTILFSAKLGDTANVWQIRLSPRNWTVEGAASRVTSGTGTETQPSVAASGSADRLAYASLIESVDIWSLPLDERSGKAGELQRLTQDVALDYRPVTSSDGRKIAFYSNRSGNFDIWLKDLPDGAETALTVTPTNENWPVFARDGSRVAFTQVQDGKSTIQMIPLLPGRGGMAEKICSDCGNRMEDWSSDGKYLIGHGGANPITINVVQVASGQTATILQHAKFDVLSPRLTSDDRWVCFVARTSPVTRLIYVAPFHGAKAISESEWIPVTDGTNLDRESRWSADGNRVYFLSDRDGFRCIWAQPLNPATKHPAGSTFPVQHFHRARLSLMNVDNTGLLGLSVARGRMFLSMGERTGNIWMSAPAERR